MCIMFEFKNFRSTSNCKTLPRVQEQGKQEKDFGSHTNGNFCKRGRTEIVPEVLLEHGFNMVVFNSNSMSAIE